MFLGDIPLIEFLKLRVLYDTIPSCSNPRASDHDSPSILIIGVNPFVLEFFLCSAILRSKFFVLPTYRTTPSLSARAYTVYSPLCLSSSFCILSAILSDGASKALSIA